MKTRKSIVLLYSFIALFLSFPLSVFSGTQADWPRSPLTGITLSATSELHEFIAYIYGWGIMIGIIAAFAVIVFAGIEYMITTTNPAVKSGALKRLISALLGIGLLLSSWLILNTINPQLTTLAPLPDLWDEGMLSGIDAEKDALSPSDCAFAMLYSEENFSGSRTKINPGRYSTSGLPYNSGKGFAKMSEKEKELYTSGDMTLANDREIIDGNYIETPGACYLSVYYTPTSFFVREERQMGGMVLPNRDFPETMWEEKNATSIEIK